MTISLPIVSTFDNKGIKRAQDALKQFGSFAADVAKIGATAVAAVGVAGIREFAQFETSFAQIKGLVGVAEDEVRKLEAAARDLAPQFGKSANEAADALFFITSAGLRGSDAVGVLEASLKASAAGLGDVNEIANAATAAMNTYGAGNLSGAEAVDVLTEAVREGQFAPEELAGALGRVLPISSELGVSFGETAGVIASLTKGGLSASEAVTGVRGAMQAILKPTGEAAKMLEEYGFTTEDVRDSVEQDGLLATFEKLREAFGDNEEDFTRVIGSIEGLNAVLSLTGENNEEYRGIVQRMTDDVGALDDAFAATSDTAQFKFDQAMATTKETLLGIGEDLIERLLPYLEDFNTFMEENGPAIQEAFDDIFGAVQFVVDEVGTFLGNLQTDEEFQAFLDAMKQTFTDMWPEIQSVITEMLELAENVLPTLTGIISEDAAPTLSNLVSIFDDLLYFTNEANNALEDLGIQVPEWTGSLKLALDPIGAVVDAVEGLARALEWARDAYDKWTGKTKGADGGAVRAAIREAFRTPRAVGGSVMGGSAYLVGERGPELFIPSTAGQIVANGQTSKMGGTTNYNVTVQAGVGDPVAIGREVVSAIKRFERVSGPVFASA